jgi:hypothetical protein
MPDLFDLPFEDDPEPLESVVESQESVVVKQEPKGDARPPALPGDPQLTTDDRRLMTAFC